jgi:hypothetical protein
VVYVEDSVPSSVIEVLEDSAAAVAVGGDVPNAKPPAEESQGPPGLEPLSAGDAHALRLWRATLRQRVSEAEELVRIADANATTTRATLARRKRKLETMRSFRHTWKGACAQ